MNLLEQEILDFALEGDLLMFHELKKQLEEIVVIERINFGRVFRIELKPSLKHYFLSMQSEQIEIPDIFAELEGLENEVAVTVIIRHGELSAIILVANDDEIIPEVPKIKRLYYTSFDLKGELVEVPKRNLNNALLML